MDATFIREGDRQELLELLEDLQHDLGKHCRLPLSLLRRDASAEEVRQALAEGLLRTRRGPTGVRSARQLWQDFERDAGPALAAVDGWDELVGAVARALAWETACTPDGPPVAREAADADLAALTPAIRALAAKLRRG